MSCTPARLAANQRNALKSTGPKSPEGKAASRLNAFKHGLAGEGTLLAPGEDAKLVEHRAKVFAQHLGAAGEMGEFLAHRAALLSVRMERLAEREIIAVEVNRAEARDQFDRERLDILDGWINDLDDPTACKPALKALEATPEGVAHLIATWETTLGAIRDGNATASDRAALWLGLSVEEADALKHRQTGRIDAEMARLRRKAESCHEMTAKIDALRNRAAIVAGFDPSPEASLARRYEAAAERGMYRAIRAIAETRRERRGDLPPTTPVEPARTLPGVDKPLDPRRPNSTSLGSFRAEILATAISTLGPILDRIEPPTVGVEPRKKRPDLRKLAKNRR